MSDACLGSSRTRRFLPNETLRLPLCHARPMLLPRLAARDNPLRARCADAPCLRRRTDLAVRLRAGARGERTRRGRLDRAARLCLRIPDPSLSVLALAASAVDSPSLVGHWPLAAAFTPTLTAHRLTGDHLRSLWQNPCCTPRCKRTGIPSRSCLRCVWLQSGVFVCVPCVCGRQAALPCGGCRSLCGRRACLGQPCAVRPLPTAASLCAGLFSYARLRVCV